MHSSAAKGTSVIEYSERIVLAYLVKFDDMWMIKQFHYLYFAMYFLEVRFIQLSFVDDLNGDLGKRRKRQKISVKLALVKCTMFGFRTNTATSSDIV